MKKIRPNEILAKDTIPNSDDEFRAYMAAQDNKSLLRFLTCGSVDDGKSTLIGRLLYDTKMIFEDQLATLEDDSKKYGTNGHDLDFALLVDGLEAEREQGITIDVAYRFFATSERKFIVADTPGHEEYTRNMATGASTADAAVILIDARRGVLEQTRRHTFIVSQLGIKHIALAINKIDLVDYNQDRYDLIHENFNEFASKLGFETITPIPLSARHGDNVTSLSQHTNWYHGPTLLNFLETISVDDDLVEKPFRFPVQYVNRPNLDFRGFCGTIASGSVRVGDHIAVSKSGIVSRVKQIVAGQNNLQNAYAGQAITILLEDETDISRGNMLVSANQRPDVADQFAASLIWFNEEHLFSGRQYIFRSETDQIPASITSIKHRININTFEQKPAKSLAMNEIGICNLSLQTPLAFDPYADNKTTGSFILIDRSNNSTVAAGMILHALRRASNLRWQAIDIDKPRRAEQKNQKPVILWFTGFSGSGKSTIANLLEKRLFSSGKHSYILDGDNIRHGLNRDLGFTEADRIENIRRIAEVAKLMLDSGLITLVSFISPFKAERHFARTMVDTHEFVEVFIDTPFDECVKRDPKGLYAKALKGEIKNFTGVDSPYEAPETPELRIRTKDNTPEAAAESIESWLRKHNYI
jgi:bifunctional enzyme CysN/CysC